jgi:dCTP deaminase
MQSLLQDYEIEDLLRSVPPLIKDFDISLLTRDNSPIKGASLDLTIGDIFVPGAKPKSIGGIRNPRRELSLESGQTAVLRSAEKLQMPKDIAGIGFPPSTRVSLAGLLSTNPGHVDPDYHGHLHLTVVNMGGNSFYLKSGDRLLRLMLFRLSRDMHHPIGEPQSPLTEELLSRLSSDFLDVDKRAKKAAQSQELRLRSMQVWATVLAAMITGGLALTYFIATGQKDIIAQIAKMEGRLSSLGGALSVVSFEEQVKSIATIDQRLRALESKSQQSAPKN